MTRGASIAGGWAIAAAIGTLVAAPAAPGAAASRPGGSPSSRSAPSGAAAVANPAVPGAAFVGSAKCRACHFPQSKSWAATRMARAFDLLKPNAAAEAKKKAGLDPAKDYTADPACLGCHTTGYGKPGGFKSAAATPDMAGVQCEACHGAASAYLKPGRMTLANREYRRSDLVAAGLILQSAANCAALCHNVRSPTHRPLDYAAGVKAEVHTLVPLKFNHD